MEEDFGGKKVDFVIIGKKGNDILFKIEMVVDNNNGIFDDFFFENVFIIVELLMVQYVEGNYDKIVLLYNKFKNVVIQIVMNE